MAKTQNNTLSTLALIFGIIGLLLSVIIIGILPAVIGFAIGIVALIKKQSKGMAIAGIVCSVLGMVLSYSVALAAVNDTSSETTTSQVEVSGTEYVDPETDEESDGIWANKFTPINDFRYTIDEANSTITLERYQGEDTKIMLSPVYTIDGIDYKLISMGDDACFLSETYITSVYIPEGVTFVGASCFNSCAQLQYIYLPSTLEDIPDTFFGYLDDYTVYCNSTSTLPAERDTNNYELLIEDEEYEQAAELGENTARAINGLLAGLNGEEPDGQVEIYFGGTDEQWSALIN